MQPERLRIASVRSAVWALLGKGIVPGVPPIEASLAAYYCLTALACDDGGLHRGLVATAALQCVCEEALQTQRYLEVGSQAEEFVRPRLDVLQPVTHLLLQFLQGILAGALHTGRGWR